MNKHTVLQAYQAVKIESGVSCASAHQLVVMLLEGALDKLTAAEGAIEQGQIGSKGQLISSVISIVGNLGASIDKDRGGEIAENLLELYAYIGSRLLEANLQSDTGIVREVKDLLKEIHAAWLQIPEEMRQQ